MKKIIRINASALKNATCMLRFYRTVIQGYKDGVNSNAVEFGSAVHLFLSEMARTSGDLPASLNAARAYYRDTKMIVTKDYLTDLKLCSVCVEYWTYLQKMDTFKTFTTENEPAVEVTFSNKFYEDDNYIILLEGTIDRLGQFDNGCNAFGDYKTTSIWGVSYKDKQIKMQQYFFQHELGCQLRFYYFNLKLKARLEPNSFIAEFCKKSVGCFIDAIFTGSKDSTEFKRSRIFFLEQDMIEFENMLNTFVKNLIRILESNKLPAREGVLNGACGGGYKLCSFFSVCNAPGDTAREHILKNSFTQQEYLPIKERD